MINKSDKDSGRPEKFDKKEVREIRLDSIIPNRFQPRKTLDESSLAELMDSIRTHGVLEPIVLRPDPKKPETYEIIMGERRWRACAMLKMETIPAVVRPATNRQMLEWALIENTHRADLNPIERARAYKQLADTFGLTHKEVAERVGTDRATVTNFIRLLNLPPEIQADVGRQTIRVGHALALLAIPDDTTRLKLWQRVKFEDLSVRHLRLIVDAHLHPRGIAVKPQARAAQYKEFHPGNDPNLTEPYARLLQKFGPNAEVCINYGKIGKQFISGTIFITCNREADFQRILKTLGN